MYMSGFNFALKLLCFYFRKKTAICMLMLALTFHVLHESMAYIQIKS